MSNPFKKIIEATREVLKEKKNVHRFILFSLAFFAVYVILPVFLIPGNDIAFQISLLRARDFALFALLSLVTGLLAVMQLHIFVRTRDAKKRAASLGQGGAGLYSAVVGGLLATAACSSCVAGLLGFLGAGSVFFIVENSIVVTSIAFAIVALSLYVTSRSVNKHCGACKVTSV